jgi:MFS family permease
MRATDSLQPAAARGSIFGWFREGTPQAQRALLAAALGWMLDAFDVMLYALVLGTLLQDFSISTRIAGFLGSLTLIASGFGGVLFGAIADRLGRKRAMIGSVLVYSVFTAMCGFSQTILQLGIFRFLLGLGMGGEWTSGAALVSETWPDHHRGKAMAWMQSAWAIGYATAAIVVAAVLPRFGWRAAFFIGVLPALLTLWIRSGVQESPIWTNSRGSQARQSIAAIFRRPFVRPTIVLTLLSLFTIFAYWGFNLWIPAYLSLPATRGGLGLSTSSTTLIVVTMQVGTFFGYVSFGYISDAFGRKKSFITFLIAASALMLLYAGTTSMSLLLLVGPLVGFFGTGFFSGFGAVAAELFPTAIRATAQGFTFNMGRFGSALAPFFIGSLAETYGFSMAFTLLSAAFAAGAMMWIWLPETRGRKLT